MILKTIPVKTPIAIFTALACTLAISGVTGCNVESHKNGDGEDVRIATPFGGMHVQTNEADAAGSIGLPAYPGATIVRKENDDKGSANVNMSFGSFQLRVKAASYRTSDSQQKVLDFYRKALGRYSTVILCQNKEPVGTPTQTDEGLSCRDESGPHARNGNGHSNDNRQIDDDLHGRYELKAGSLRHQHIVSVHVEDDGTRFGLVALDLPIELHPGGRDKDDNGEHVQ
jgi:hypothetical protein